MCLTLKVSKIWLANILQRIFSQFSACQILLNSHDLSCKLIWEEFLKNDPLPSHFIKSPCDKAQKSTLSANLSHIPYLISLKLLVISKGTKPRIWFLYLNLNLHQRKQLFHVFFRILHKNSFVKNLFGKYKQIRGLDYIYLNEINFRGYLFSRMQVFPYFA